MKNKDNEENREAVSFTEYDITTSANDFNVQTLYNFIESGVIEIPNFQRNYVWEISRASKLIESLIMGLPVPQIFLYEKSKNKFLVIDGQQRLMTIYYFMKKRFPKIPKRAELGKIFLEKKIMPSEILHNDEYFNDFNLKLPKRINQNNNPLDGENYETLDSDSKSIFNLRPIRTMIIKQLKPEDGDSSIYEIFSRLNTGGINLKNQEIRACLYHSHFYDKLNEMNDLGRWREIYGAPIHKNMQDIENILRGFAYIDLDSYSDYKGSLNKFLNSFSQKMMTKDEKTIGYLYNLFLAFLEKTKVLEKDIFFSKKNKFNILLYEAIFYAVCKNAYDLKSLELVDLDNQKINKIKNDPDFREATESETGKKKSVEKRFEVASRIISGN